MVDIFNQRNSIKCRSRTEVTKYPRLDQKDLVKNILYKLIEKKVFYFYHRSSQK